MKKIPLIAAALAGALLATAAVAGARPAASKPVDITVWHAQTDSAQKTIHALVAKFNKTHPGIVVHDELGSNGDEMVQKLQAVIGSDNYPDIAYVYGSDVPNVSQSSKVVDISKDIKATRLRLEQPLPGGSQHGDGRLEDRRLPGRDRQPGRRLQQEAAQGRRRRAAQGELDVGRLPRDGQEAHEREQGHLRHGLPDLGQRGHGLAALADDLAAGRRGAEQATTRRRCSPERRGRRRCSC